VNKPDGITFELCSFTCDEIEDILKASNNVRSIAPRNRDKYFQSMIAGTWNCANGDVLVFDKRGMCLDGQHRLSAACAYQKSTGDSVWFWCAKNAEPTAALTKDQGLTRTLAGVLKRDGVRISTKCASIVISQLSLKENSQDISCLRGCRTTAGLAQQYEFWLKNQERVLVMAKLAARCREEKISRGAILSQVICEIHRLCGDDALKFAEFILTGANLSKNDPAYLLRKRLLQDYAETRHKLSAEVAIALIVTAWNHWVQGNTMHSLQWRGIGPRAQPFPSIYVPNKDAV
tara:strand:- start:353 stop:1222 length:870 start_codon:yes stop_codon:yes gene_type:complete